MHSYFNCSIMATFPQKQQSLKCLPNYKTSCQWWTNGVDKILFLLCKVKKIHHYCWSLFLISIPLIYLDCGTHSNVAFSIPSPQKHRCHTTMYVCMHYLTTPPPPLPSSWPPLYKDHFPLSPGGHFGQVKLCSFYLPVEIHHSLQ